MNRSSISVVITCYNLGPFLEECLASVAAQTLAASEVVVVDDGSTDEETKVVLDRVESQGVRVLRGPNQGLPRARNRGIAETSAPVVCCLDADDCLSADYLEACTAVLDRDDEKRVGIVTTDAQFFGVRQQRWTTRPDDLFEHFVENTIHVSSVFRRDCWERVGGYDEQMTGYQDWDFWLRIRTLGFECQKAQGGLLQYRIRPNSMVKTSDANRQRLYRQILTKQAPFLASRTTELLESVQSVRTRDAEASAHHVEDLEKAFLAEQKRATEALALVRATEELERLRRQELAEVGARLATTEAVLLSKEALLKEWNTLKSGRRLLGALIDYVLGKGILRN